MDISSFILILTPVVFVAGAAGAIHAVLNARTSQGAIAWALSMIYLPVIALPLYAVFGRGRFRGYVEARRAAADFFERHRRRLVAAARDTRPAGAAGIASIEACERLAGLPLTGGNRVELLVNGRRTFDEIFSAIDRAEAYVLLASYIIRDDGLGRELFARLAARARQGVRVCVLYDEMGGQPLREARVGEFAQAGVKVSAFNSTKGPRNRLQLNFRNHRKIVVIDGRTAFVGGHNVGDEYLGLHPTMSPWRDTHVRLDGPAAQCCQLVFLEDWHWATGELLDLDWNAEVPAGGKRSVLILPSGPADDLETCALFFTHVINSAARRIWIVSPYFVPDIDVLTALKLAALRGVDVRVMVPEMRDHLAVWLAAFSYFGEAQASGVKIFRYTGGFLHQKVMLIDDVAAAVGTANLDNRSFRLNFEITALVTDRGFAAEVASMLEHDFAQSYRYDHGTFRERPLWVRLGAPVARLASPIL